MGSFAVVSAEQATRNEYIRKQLQLMKVSFLKFYFMNILKPFSLNLTQEYFK